jgi:hypothetical protein
LSLIGARSRASPHGGYMGRAVCRDPRTRHDGG